ncbi:MAG: HNH endonuclease [Gammaproteobacteria bacterium]|nr:HNH endonuclease [Gammaproteobacteria bacterium]
MARKPSSKEKILSFFLENQGKILHSQQIQDASGGVVEWARRVRELRQAGWNIMTHNDRADLKPGQYVLEDATPPSYKIPRTISNRLRAQVLERNGYTCQMCGVGAGDKMEDGRRVILHIAHVVDYDHGGKEELSNLRAMCSICNQGAKNLVQEPPSWTWLLGQLRRASQDDQKAALEWLKKKFREDKK